MIGPGLPGQTLEAFADGFQCGQVGSITVTIDDGDGNNLVGPTTASIIEIECSDDNVATYRYLGVFPSEDAVITWDGLNIAGTEVTASEEITVSLDAPSVPSDDGPCSAWIEPEDVADCCSDLLIGSDNIALVTAAIDSAQLLLYEASGRRWSGLCGPITVRPCGDMVCGFQVLSRGHIVGNDFAGWNWTGGYWSGYDCSCPPISKIKLAGTVQGIAQIKIDGEVIAPSEYRVDKKRYLVRTDDGRWPSCQDRSRSDDQVGTFSVSYWYGKTPPQAGKDAVAQLACEIWKSCPESGIAECALPNGVTRVTRQGITIERTFLQRDANGIWRSGLGAVDLFLNTMNPAGIPRRGTFTSPSTPARYAQRTSS